jgi:phosphohistidine phosphatase
MKTLLILRHAKSSWADPGMADHDRRLNDRGKRDAPRMGKLIAELGLHPDIIVSSSAKRARSTAKRVIEAGGFTCPKQLLEELYLAPANTYIETLRQLGDAGDCVLAIGHNPGLEQLVATLTGDFETLPTAALVQIDFDIDSWAELPCEPKGQLRGVWRPKEMA